MVALQEKNSRLQSLLNELQQHKGPDKAKIYTQISCYLKDPDSQEFSQVVEDLKSVHGDLTRVLVDDVRVPSGEVAQSALHTLGFLAHYDSVVAHLTEEESHDVLEALCCVIHKTTDKTVCTRALWCIAKQSFRKKALIPKLEDVVKAIEHGQCGKNFQSMTVEHEALNALIRLLEQLPVQMVPLTTTWGRLVYPLLLHGSAKVRDRALIAVDISLPSMLLQQDVLAKTLVPDLKAMLISEMTKLMTAKQEAHVLQVWCFYVKILGKALHHGGLINLMLPVVEQGFKHPQPSVKCAAYKAWSALIENFSLNPDIIGDHKRVKLLMQVFRINNAKLEVVAMEKLSVWWFFVLQLGEKAPLYFEQVCVPLLQYCTGLPPQSTSVKPGMRTPTLQRLGSSPATPQMSLGGSGSAGNASPFKSVQQKGCEILAHMLGKGAEGPDNPAPKFTVASPEHDVIPGMQFFTKHATTFISAVQQCIINVGEDMGDELLGHIWYSLVAHMKNVLELSQKKDSADIFSRFMQSFRDIVQSQCLKPHKLLKLFQAVLCLPVKALSSSAYSVGTSSAVMKGCPAIFLLETLFHHRIIETCLPQERFFSVYEKLISCGFQNSSSSLSFCQEVVKLLENSASDVDSLELLWRLWSAIAHPLNDHIVKNNEVNQGNVLENDFSSCLKTLCFPVQYLFSAKMPQPTLKSLMKTWSELYRSFARIAAMVTNAAANASCEEWSEELLEVVTGTRLMDAVWVEQVAQCCHTVVECVDFSGFTGSSSFFSLHTTSPAPLSKTKSHPLGNIHSLVKLVCKLVHHVTEENAQAASSGGNLQVTLVTLTQIFSSLVIHMPTSHMVAALVEHASSTMAELLSGAGQGSGNKVFTTLVVQKVEKLWTDLTTAMQSRYTGMYDSDMLVHVAPLLAVALLHKRRAIKNQAMIMWNATFAKSSSLTYPEALKPVLATVKEKTPSIVLPGWDITERVLVEETPCSEMTQGESQGPVPINVIGVVSPRKPIGSFLHKAASPGVKHSPLKPPVLSKSPTGTAHSGVKRKLQVEDLNTQDFVVIASSPRKKRVLTEHQKDVMKEKKDLPALYSAVDVTMDGSCTNPFTIDSQSQHSSTPTPTQTPVVEVPPFALFGSSKSSVKEGKTDKPAITEAGGRPVTTEENNSSEISSSIIEVPGPSITEATDVNKPRRVGRRRSVRFAKSSVESEASQESDIESSASIIDNRGVERKSKVEEVKVNVVGLEEGNVVVKDSSDNRPCDQDNVFMDLTSSNTKVDRDAVETKVTDNLGPTTEDDIPDALKSKTSVDTPSKKQLKISDLLTPSQTKQDGEQPTESDLSVTHPVKKKRDRSRRQSSQNSPSDSSQSQTASLRSQVNQSPRRTPRGRQAKSDVAKRSPSPKKRVEPSPGTIDKWFTSALSSGGQSSGCSSRKSSQGLFSSLTDETRTEVASNSNTANPVIMVEDTQQFSPPSETAKKDEHSVKETPVKTGARDEDSRVPPSKMLFTDAVGLNVASEVIPDSEAAAVNEPDVDSCNNQKGLTSVVSSKALEVADVGDAVTMATDRVEQPVVMLQKLSDSELANYSPTMNAAQSSQRNANDSMTESGNSSRSPALFTEDLASSHQNTTGKSDSSSDMTSLLGKDTMVPNIEPMEFDSGDADVANDTIASGRNWHLVESSISGSSSGASLVSSGASVESGPRRSGRKPKSVVETDKSTEPEAGLDQLARKSTMEADDDDGDEVNLIPDVGDQDDALESNTGVSMGTAAKSESFPITVVSGDDIGMQEVAAKAVCLPVKSLVTTNGMDLPLSLLAVTPSGEAKKSSESSSPQIDSQSRMLTENAEDDSDDEDDIPLSQIIRKRASVEDEEPNSAEKSIVDKSLVDLEFAVMSSSTPDITLKKHGRPRSSEKNNGTQKNSTPRRRLSLKFKQKDSREVSNLSIEMHSPKVKRLRGKSPGCPRLGHRILNKSLDSSKKTLRKRRAKVVASAKDDLEVDFLAQEEEMVKLDTIGEVAVITNSIPLIVKNEGERNKMEPVADEEQITMETEADDDKQEVSSNTDNTNVTEPSILPVPIKTYPTNSDSLSSPLGETPPPPSLSTTPTSLSKFSSMSRASLILQRARLMLGSPYSTPQSQRIQTVLPNKAYFSDGKIQAPRSILKSPSSNPGSPKKLGLPIASHKMSPPSSFRPIRVPCIYSPSASPSAGILRKRRIKLKHTDIPSPSNRRRVSFSELVETREIPNKRRVAKPRLLTPALSKAPETETPPLMLPPPTVTEKPVSASPALEDTPAPPTDSITADNSIQSTAESQLNCNAQVFPALVECQVPIERLLPKLTSSVWLRGLEQVFKAKNIHTVGHLSALSEYDIHHLPIRSPKVPTVIKVLETFSKQHGISTGSPTVVMEEGVNELSPVGKEIHHITEGALNTSVDSEEGVTEEQDLLEEIRRLEEEDSDKVTGASQGHMECSDLALCQKEDETLSDKPGHVEGRNDSTDSRLLLKKAEEVLGMLVPEAMSDLPTHTLLRLHNSLHSVMGNVMNAVKSKCLTSSQGSSQSSQ